MSYPIRTSYVALVAVAAVILLTCTPLHPVAAIALAAIAPLAAAAISLVVCLLAVALVEGFRAVGVVIDAGVPVVVYEDDIVDLLILAEVGEIRDPEGFIEDFATRVGVA